MNINLGFPDIKAKPIYIGLLKLMMHKQIAKQKKPNVYPCSPILQKRIADISNKLKPKISFPVFDAIKSAYTIAKPNL